MLLNSRFLAPLIEWQNWVSRRVKTMSLTQKIFDFFSRKTKASNGGGDKAISKQHAGGKMTARERIDYLLDDSNQISIQNKIKSSKFSQLTSVF